MVNDALTLLSSGFFISVNALFSSSLTPISFRTSKGLYSQSQCLPPPLRFKQESLSSPASGKEITSTASFSSPSRRRSPRSLLSPGTTSSSSIWSMDQAAFARPSTASAPSKPRVAQPLSASLTSLRLGPKKPWISGRLGSCSRWWKMEDLPPMRCRFAGTVPTV